MECPNLTKVRRCQWCKALATPPPLLGFHFFTLMESLSFEYFSSGHVNDAGSS